MIAITLFVVIVMYSWIASKAIRFSSKKMQSQTAGIVTAAVFFLLPTWDSIWGAVQFRYLCAAEGGFKIVRTAQAAGFFDADQHSGCEGTCAEALTKRGFQFVEMDVITPLWLTKSKGLQRFYLADAGSPNCSEFDRYLARHNGYFYANITIPKLKCVAGDSIASVTAQYDLAIAQDGGVAFGPTKIDRVESYVRDRGTGEVLAAAASFRSWGGWLSKPLSFGSASVCPSWKDSHGPIEQVLKGEGASN